MVHLQQPGTHSAATPTIKVEERGDLFVISFEPGRDGHARHDAVLQFFNHEFRKRTAKARWILIDLHRVMILDSSCLGSLMEAHGRVSKAGGALILCGIDSPRLREVLAITCFDKVLPVHKTRAEGETELARRGAKLTVG